jgi:ferritin-like metal-binding protein YciE
METAREFFIHGLKGMLDAERKLVEILGQMSEESSRSELEKGFSSHRAQTQKQVERLEQVFEEIGEEPEQVECHGLEGLRAEKEAFMEEDPTEDLIDMFNAEAGIKTERYEISAYEGLIRVAEELELRKAVRLLNQNLKEEQQMEKKLDSISRKLKPNELGMEEEVEEGEEERESTRSGRRPRRGRAA